MSRCFDSFWLVRRPLLRKSHLRRLSCPSQAIIDVHRHCRTTKKSDDELYSWRQQKPNKAGRRNSSGPVRTPSSILSPSFLSFLSRRCPVTVYRKYIYHIRVWWVINLVFFSRGLTMLIKHNITTTAVNRDLWQPVDSLSRFAAAPRLTVRTSCIGCWHQLDNPFWIAGMTIVLSNRGSDAASIVLYRL